MSKLNLGVQVLGAFYELSKESKISIVEAHELKIEDGIELLVEKGYVKRRRISDLTEYSLTSGLNTSDGKSYCEYLVRRILEDIGPK